MDDNSEEFGDLHDGRWLHRPCPTCRYYTSVNVTWPLPWRCQNCDAIIHLSFFKKYE